MAARLLSSAWGPHLVNFLVPYSGPIFDRSKCRSLRTLSPSTNTSLQSKSPICPEARCVTEDPLEPPVVLRFDKFRGADKGEKEKRAGYWRNEYHICGWFEETLWIVPKSAEGFICARRHSVWSCLREGDPHLFYQGDITWLEIMQYVESFSILSMLIGSIGQLITL